MVYSMYTIVTPTARAFHSERKIAMEKEKKVYIQFLRIVACFLVIVNHTNSLIFLSTSPSPLWFASLTYFFTSKIAVPLFLMIMGALLLERQDTPKKSLQRFLRILIVLLVSSVLCYLYFGIAGGNLGNLSILQFFQLTLSSSMTNAFWYLYLYLGLLCLLPLFQKMIQVFDQKDLGWLLFLTMGVMGTAPLLPIFFPSLSLHPDFTAPLFSPYIGAVFCGYYMEHYIPNTRKTFAISCALFLGLIAFQVSATLGLYYRDPASYLQLDDRTLLPILACAASFYLMVRYLFAHVRFPDWLLSGIRRLGSLTFGIYLLSDLAIELLAPVFLQLSQQLPILAAMVLWELAIFILSAIVTALLKLIPPLRRLL